MLRYRCRNPFCSSRNSSLLRFTENGLLSHFRRFKDCEDYQLSNPVRDVGSQPGLTEAAAVDVSYRESPRNNPGGSPSTLCNMIDDPPVLDDPVSHAPFHLHPELGLQYPHDPHFPDDNDYDSVSTAATIGDDSDARAEEDEEEEEIEEQEEEDPSF